MNNGRCSSSLSATRRSLLGGIRRYAQIVREHALMRRLLSTTYEIQASVLNHQAVPRELVEQAEQRIFELLRNERAKRDISLADAISEELERIHQASQSDREYLGPTSGLRDLDELTGGWQAGNFTDLASRPGMGKSSVALNFATHAAFKERAAVLFAQRQLCSYFVIRTITAQAERREGNRWRGRTAENTACHTVFGGHGC